MSFDPELRMLAEADPAADVTLSPIEGHAFLKATLNASQSAADQVSAVSGWRSRAARIGIGAIAIGVAVPAIAFAGAYLAQTGRFFEGGPRDEIGPERTEVIDRLSPDYVDYAVSQWPDYVTLPDSLDAKDFARRVAQEQYDNEQAEKKKAEATGEDAEYGSVEGANGIPLSFEMAASCAWLDEWLRADAAGDRAAVDEASAMIEQATTWKYSVMFFDASTMRYAKETAAAARAGDRATVQAEAAVCSETTKVPGGGR